MQAIQFIELVISLMEWRWLPNVLIQSFNCFDALGKLESHSIRSGLKCLCEQRSMTIVARPFPVDASLMMLVTDMRFTLEKLWWTFNEVQ